MSGFDSFSADETLRALRAQLRLLGEKGRFRPGLYASAELCTLKDIEALPFTGSVDIISHGKDMLCVSPRDVARVVSLSTSGTSGAAKRLYFTEGDLERTVRFFAEGMSLMCRSGDRTAVIMPVSAESGLTSLLCEGLRRIGSEARVIPPNDYASTADALRGFKPDVIVASPAYLRRIALSLVDIRPHSVLLSADYCSAAVRDTIARAWGCRVFTHYGLAETGLGCAVQCPSLDAMHIRSDEVYIEIIDPATGRVLPAGERGEIVFSTLRREAMPLIRYRTGDLGALAPCRCGSSAPALAGVYGRVAEAECSPSLYELDEALFACDGILDFTAERSADGVSVTVDGDCDAARRLCAPLGITDVRSASLLPPDGRSKRTVKTV